MGLVAQADVSRPNSLAAWVIALAILVAASAAHAHSDNNSFARYVTDRNAVAFATVAANPWPITCFPHCGDGAVQVSALWSNTPSSIVSAHHTGTLKTKMR